MPSALSGSEKRLLKIVYFSGGEFKHHVFEADCGTASDIRNKLNYILVMRTSPARMQYLAMKEKKLLRKQSSFHIPSWKWLRTVLAFIELGACRVCFCKFVHGTNASHDQDYLHLWIDFHKPYSGRVLGFRSLESCNRAATFWTSDHNMFVIFSLLAYCHWDSESWLCSTNNLNQAVVFNMSHEVEFAERNTYCSFVFKWNEIKVVNICVAYRPPGSGQQVCLILTEPEKSKTVLTFLKFH